MLMFHLALLKSTADDNIMDLSQRHIIFHYHDQKISCKHASVPGHGAKDAVGAQVVGGPRHARAPHRRLQRPHAFFQRHKLLHQVWLLPRWQARLGPCLQLRRPRSPHNHLPRAPQHINGVGTRGRGSAW